MDTKESLAPPYFTLKSSTQTTLDVQIIRNTLDVFKDYTFEYSETPTDNVIKSTGLRPGESYTYRMTIKLSDMSYTISQAYKTKDITPTVNASDITASSAAIIGTYIDGDANVTSQKITFNGKTYEGPQIKATGLDPNRSYTVKYEIEVTYGKDNKWATTYSGSNTFKTAALTLTTQQPKIVSLGNAIVSAESNLDDTENNVGFEWRRTDWTDDFESNKGTAYLYEGAMEGYIHNLNTDKLWKFRPYYCSDNGNYYYGGWVGLDPTNVSYFEPTVHTYAQIEVKGNTAQVKGYAVAGTDNVTVQGFKYWKNTSASRSDESNRASSVPSDATTVTATGEIMEISLTNLDYESTYGYVAFATTSQGTFYGEVRTFTTGENPTGIYHVTVDKNANDDVHEVARFNMQGRWITIPEKGINIIRMSDGSIKKVFVK